MSDLNDSIFGFRKCRKKAKTTKATKTTTINSGIPFTKGCDAAKLLRSMMENGEIHQGAQPKEIWLMRKEFQQHPLDSFRQGFYKLRNELGFHLRENVMKNKSKSHVFDSCSFVVTQAYSGICFFFTVSFFIGTTRYSFVG